MRGGDAILAVGILATLFGFMVLIAIALTDDAATRAEKINTIFLSAILFRLLVMGEAR